MSVTVFLPGHSPSIMRVPLYPGAPKPCSADLWIELPVTVEPWLPWERWSPGVSGNSSYSELVGSEKWPVCERRKQVTSSEHHHSCYSVCVCIQVYLSFLSVSVMASPMSSQSFSRELRVFWTVWLMVFSMVRHTSSIWLTQRLGCTGR